MERDLRSTRTRLRRLQAELEVVASGAHASIPGRRSLTDGLASGADHTAGAEHGYRTALAGARAALADLERAYDAVDAYTAIALVARWTSELGSARTHAERLATAPKATALEQLARLEALAEPLLACAPVPSSGAIHAGLVGDWTTWDREIETWRAGVVQRKAAGRAPSLVGSPAVIAARGIANANERLPFAPQIQAAFGRHDVSDVRVQIGGEAAIAAAALGARAYATGSTIAFATAPDLFTAAHEAAHVIQQRAGVSLGGEIDRGDDAYERAADEVADAVVGGRSAEALLDRHARVAPGGAAIQRRPAPEIASTIAQEAAFYHYDAKRYAIHNSAAVLESIPVLLDSIAPPHPRLAWTAGALQAVFARAVDLAYPGQGLELTLPLLLAPLDPWTVIDHHRLLHSGVAGQTVDGEKPYGTADWYPEVGRWLALDVAAAAKESLQRMIPRFLARLDEATGPVVAADLASSHPMDRVMAVALCDRAVVQVTPSAAKDGVPDAAARRVAWRWLGSTSRSLWNWIEVTTPRDATREEVALALLEDDKKHDHAFEIVAAPPYFRIDPARAMAFPEAQDFAPDGAFASHADNALGLADSSLATDAGIAQSTGLHGGDKIVGDRAALQDTIERSQRQLQRMSDALAPWGLWQPLIPARSWLARYDGQLASVSDERLEGLALVLADQQALLARVAPTIRELTVAAGQAFTAEPDDGPNRSALRAYAIAAGESHLVQSALAQVRVAAQLAARITTASLEQSVNDSADALGPARIQDDGDPAVDTVGRANESLQNKVWDVRRRQLVGAPVELEEIAEIAAHGEAHGFDTRMLLLQRALGAARGAVLDAISGPMKALAALFSPRLKRLPDILVGINNEIGEIVDRFHRAIRGESTTPDTMRGAVATAEREVAALRKREDLDGLFREVSEKIEDQAVRTQILEVAILIGISVAAAMTGGAAAAAVRGAMLADTSIAAASLAGETLFADTLVGAAVDAGINTAGQMAVTGDASLKDFGENMVTNVALHGLFRWGGKALEGWKVMRAGEGMSRLGAFAASAARGVTLLSAQTIAGMAVSYTVHRLGDLETGTIPDEKTTTQWLIEGGTMAVGSILHKQLEGMQVRITTSIEVGVNLRLRVRRATERAEVLSRGRDPDGAIEATLEYRALLEEERAAIAKAAANPTPKVDAKTLATLAKGNAAELAALSDHQFAMMQLRLSGLEPDEAGEQIWIGDSEQIAIALYQAKRAGFEVAALERDDVARQWRVRYAGTDLTILERKLRGQPRSAKAEVAEEDRLHARRYAEAARALNLELSRAYTERVNRESVIERDYVQVGAGMAGTINQATLHSGVGTTMVIASNDGTLGQRGTQELGQEPTAWNAPGLRGSEQSPAGAPLMTSDALGRSLDIGRFEIQNPVYFGTTSGQIERRPPMTRGTDWEAPDRHYRMTVTDELSGTTRKVYFDSTDLAVGPGPGDFAGLRPIVGDRLGELRSAGLVISGDDPQIATKLRGERIFVMGSSPTGAWAAELAASKDGRVATLAGDTPAHPDWSQTLEEYDRVMQQIALSPGEQAPPALAGEKARLEAVLASAHTGKSLARNTRPGAAYARPDRITIAYGSPERVSKSEGGLMITMGGQTAMFDQIVVCHGQDFGGPNGPGAMLGAPAPEVAPRVYGEVPEGTIALRPVYGGDPPVILELEAVDFPGIRLKGAAAAVKKATPWIVPAERSRFVEAVDRMSAQGARTRDYGPISSDSHTVSGGIEVQRDKIPRANERRAAREYKLPGAESSLDIEASSPAELDARVREYIVANLRGNPEWISVRRLSGGRSDAILYDVQIGGEELGVLKLFPRDGAEGEQKMLELLAKADLTKMTAVAQRGVITLTGSSTHGSAILMDKAPGQSVKDVLADGATVDMPKLTAAVKQVGAGLGEMHRRFASGGEMTRAQKLSDATYLLDKNFNGGPATEMVRAAFGERDFERVKATMTGPMLEAFLNAKVPATAYHGDANAGNFIVGGYDPERKRFASVGVIDVGSMQWSVDTDGRGTKTGAADVGRFLESLETVAPGRLSAAQLELLKTKFLEQYEKELGTTVDRTFFDADRWYRLELELAALKSDPTAKMRVLHLLGMEPAP